MFKLAVCFIRMTAKLCD